MICPVGRESDGWMDAGPLNFTDACISSSPDIPTNGCVRWMAREGKGFRVTTVRSRNSLAIRASISLAARSDGSSADREQRGESNEHHSIEPDRARSGGRYLSR